MLPKISVVIPVYNVEKYLNRCVDSILNQTFQDFEILLVNDGSNDNSGKICDEYARVDKRIKVIHKKNARVAAARNDGIKMAKGKYISFIDSDDWIDPKMYKEMVYKAEELNLDIIMCDYKKKAIDYEYPRTQPIRGGYYSKNEIKNELFQCLIMFDNIELPPTVSNWVCLFNLEFLRNNNLYYDEDIHYCEDTIFGSKILYHAANFYYLKDHYYYNYYSNPNSTTNTYNEKKWDSYLKVNDRLIQYFQQSEQFDFSKQIKINMLYFTLNALGQLKYFKINWDEKISIAKKIIYHPKVSELFRGLELHGISWKMKLGILLIRFKMVWLYSFLVLNNPKPKLYIANEIKNKEKVISRL